MRKGILILFLLNGTVTALVNPNDLTSSARQHPSDINLLSAQANEVRPLRTVVSNAAAEARQIDLLEFDFQQIYYGFEGPNYIPLKGEPPAGAQLIAEAQLFKAEAVSTAKFEFIDASGRDLSPLFFRKKSGDVFNGDFVGVVNIPNEPFKIRVSGLDVTGKPYRRTYSRLFRPIKGRPVGPRLPAGVPADQAASLKRMIEAYDQQTRTELIEEGRRNPDGTITLPQVEVSEATYEPLITDRGNVIGLRIRYALRVSQDGNYSFQPWVWPAYSDTNLRAVEMHSIAVTTDPLPEGLNAKTSALHLRYGRGATYRAGKTYRFVVDTIPSFAIQNAQRTRFCIMRSKFRGSAALEATWRLITMSDQPVPYATNIRWTTFAGRTGSFSGLGVFYRSFLKEGAQECSVGGNINF